MRAERLAGGRIWVMVVMVLLGVIVLAVAYYVGAKVIGPPQQPLGPYQLVERQVRSFRGTSMIFSFFIFIGGAVLMVCFSIFIFANTGGTGIFRLLYILRGKRFRRIQWIPDVCQ